MFYSLFPLILIFVCLAAAVIIIVRKFPQLAALEPEKLPEVQQAKVKEEIRLQKFSRGLSRFSKKIKHWLRIFGFLGKGWKNLQTKFRLATRELKERYQKSVLTEIKKAIQDVREGRKVKQKKPAAEPSLSAEDLLKQAEALYERGDFPSAERRYIEAVKSDARNIEAYRGLGKVYLEIKKYKEAKETFEFLLKLQPDDDRACNRLGMIAEAENDWKKAAEYFEQAVKLNDRLAIRFYDLGRAYEALKRPAAALRNFAKAMELEPNNPKYLDRLLEMSIITGDKELAKDTYDRLRMGNPENQKLAEFKERIEEMEE